MKINWGHAFLFSVFSLAMMYSCATSREGNVSSDCRKWVSEKDLKEYLFAKDTIPFEHFYTRIGVDINSVKNTNIWFATSIKMRVDSAFSGTVKVGPAVVATFLVGLDSIIVSNKAQKCYIRQNFDYISSILGVEMQYDFLQDLLLGLPIGLDRSWDFKQIRDKEFYVLAAKKKRKYRRVDGEVEEDEIEIQYFMSCEDFDLEKISIQIPTDTVDMTIFYKNKKIADGFTVPNITHLHIVHPQDSIRIAINSGVVKINSAHEVSVNISEDYEECP